MHGMHSNLSNSWLSCWFGSKLWENRTTRDKSLDKHPAILVLHWSSLKYYWVFKAHLHKTRIIGLYLMNLCAHLQPTMVTFWFQFSPVATRRPRLRWKRSNAPLPSLGSATCFWLKYILVGWVGWVGFGDAIVPSYMGVSKNSGFPPKSSIFIGLYLFIFSPRYLRYHHMVTMLYGTRDM